MKTIFIYTVAFLCLAQASDLEPISPVNSPMENQSSKSSLGLLLFQDKRLSKNNTISCSSCHNLQTNGADVLAKSLGVDGVEGNINAPTVFNSSLNFVQFWDGRAKTLEDQVDGPVQHPKEMASNWKEVVLKIKAEVNYDLLFKKIYPDGITANNIKDAIAQFEKGLITPNSKFDLYLKGNKLALSETEIRGYFKFKQLGCIACHQGQNVGGNMFQGMGIMGDYFKDRKGLVSKEDLGRFNVTGLEQDKHVFRVPSLRNVALTPPYFHDGSAKTLPEAIRIMGKYQLGKVLNDEDVKLLVAFLKTLNGEKPLVLRDIHK